MSIQGPQNDNFLTLWKYIAQHSNTCSRPGYSTVISYVEAGKITCILLTSKKSRVLYNSSIPAPPTVLRQCWAFLIIFFASFILNFLARKNRLHEAGREKFAFKKVLCRISSGLTVTSSRQFLWSRPLEEYIPEILGHEIVLVFRPA